MRRRDAILTMLRTTPGAVSYRWLSYVTRMSREQLAVEVTTLRIEGHRIVCARGYGYSYES